MMHKRVYILGVILIIVCCYGCQEGFVPISTTDATNEFNIPDVGTDPTVVPDSSVGDAELVDVVVPNIEDPDVGVPDTAGSDTSSGDIHDQDVEHQDIEDQDIEDQDIEDQDIEDQDTDENTPDADSPVEPPPSIGDIVGMSAGGGIATSANYRLVVGIGQMPTGQLESANYRVNVAVAPPPRN